jgi:hypothetical protein
MPVISIVFVVMVAFALMALKLFNSLRTMRIQMGVGVIVSRYESPLFFWLVRIAMFGGGSAAGDHIRGVLYPS